MPRLWVRALPSPAAQPRLRKESQVGETLTVMTLAGGGTLTQSGWVWPTLARTLRQRDSV